MAEVLAENIDKINQSDIHLRLNLIKGKYILLSAHKEENINTEENFLSLFNAINAIAEYYQLPILYSCHPRSKKRLEESGFKLNPLVIQHEPLAFHDYNCLQANAFCVISDSGTLPEALDKGCFVLAGIDQQSLLNAVKIKVEMHMNNDLGNVVPDYIDKNVSNKIVNLIQSYTGIVDKFVWRKKYVFQIS